MAQQFSEGKTMTNVISWHFGTFSFPPLLHFGQVLTRIPVYVALYRIGMVVAKTILVHSGRISFIPKNGER